MTIKEETAVVLNRVRTRVAKPGAWPWLSLNIHLLESGTGLYDQHQAVRRAWRILAQRATGRTYSRYDRAHRALERWEGEAGRTQADVQGLLVEP